MALHLSVPAREDKPPIPAETRPKVVQELVDRLSYSHPVSAAQALLEPLTLLNRQAAGPDSRLKLMELYRPAVLNVTRELAAHCAGHALPLPDDAMAAAATARTLLTELAYGYKLAILDQINRVFAIGGNKTLAILAQRAIHALDQLLQVSYYTYTSAPEGVWSEIHRIYLHAAQQGVYEIEVTDTAIKSTTVNQTYKNALLFALANPHRLAPTDLASVTDYIARFGHLAQLQALGKPENPAGVFLVQLKSDQIPVPISKHKGVADMRTDILMITVELARKVSEHLNGLQENVPPSRLGLPEAALQRHYQDLLSHLLKHWALNPKRTSSRLAKNESINLVVGLDAAHYYLNGEKELSGNEPAGDDSEEILNFTGKPVRNSGSASRSEPTRWLVVNESAGGMALSKFPGTQSTVQVGDLLALRSDRDTQWSLAVVRRASSNDTGDLEIGTQMVAPHAKASAIRPEQGDVYERVLLLPELPGLKQPATLVAKGGLYQPARVLELKVEDDNKTIKVLATRLIERTNGFERFQFSVL